MAVNASDFVDNVTAALVQLGICQASEIPDGDLDQFNDFVVQQMQRLAERPKVVLFLDQDGGSPTVHADRDVEVALLRQGLDLADRPEHEIFFVDSPGAHGSVRQVAGHTERAVRDSALVASVFAALVPAASASTPAAEAGKHYPVEWGPSNARRLTCSCGNPDPGHADGAIQTGKTAIHRACKAVLRGYARGESGAGDRQLQKLVDLGDIAQLILQEIGMPYEEASGLLSDEEHAEAVKEGWALFSCYGPEGAEYQLQRIDSPDEGAGELKGDSEAWALVFGKDTPLHMKVRGLLQQHSPHEHAKILKWQAGESARANAELGQTVQAERDALRNLLISARDSRKGYADRNLHEPWSATEARAVQALKKLGVNLED